MFTWYFDAVSRCRFQTYRTDARTAKIQMLIWRHICFGMTFFIAQCNFKIVKVSQQRCTCICFQEFFSVTVELLQEDHTELKKGTKLNLMDIEQLLELCLNEDYFLYNNVIWTLENSEWIVQLNYKNKQQRNWCGMSTPKSNSYS